jgi:hypothetical protein
MKKLYQVTYHTVIYAEEEMVEDIARACTDQGLFIQKGSIYEINNEFELPPEWSITNYPVIDEDGDLAEDDLGTLIDKIAYQAPTIEKINKLKKEIEVLENQLKNYKP